MPAIIQDPAKSLSTKGIETPLQVTIQCLGLTAIHQYWKNKWFQDLNFNLSPQISKMSHTHVEQPNSVSDFLARSIIIVLHYLTQVMKNFWWPQGPHHMHIWLNCIIQQVFKWVNFGLANEAFRSNGTASLCSISRAITRTSAITQQVQQWH